MLSKHESPSHCNAFSHRTLRNRESEDSVSETNNKGIKVWVDAQKASIYSIKGSIGEN